MARLTRTAKYADLREQLANDKEENVASQDLSSYQNRFDNVQDTLSFTPKKEEAEYVWQPFNNTDTFNQSVEPIKQWEEVKTEPVVEQTPVDEVKPEPVVEQTPVEEVKPEPVVEQPKQENSYFDSFMNGQVEETKQNDNFNSYFENTSNDSTPIEAIKEVFEDVQDDSGEIVSLKERETYLNQTFSDVNSYNINNGLKTIDQLVENSIDEVRHPENNSVETPVYEEPIDNTQVWTPIQEEVLDADKVDETKINDEEFSNTVSMEISKIMDEVATAPVQEEVKPEVVEEVKTPEPIEEEIAETIELSEEVVEEKPEEVVEIKNIAEIEAEPTKDTMSSTIPFVVAAEDEEVVDEDEEDGSNTVLNVILIVLIVVLVAVLGLIVFYILKTKGIF